MEILAALLTIVVAWRTHRFWPAGLLWIVGLALAATIGSALVLNLLRPDAALGSTAWIGVFAFELVIVAMVYAVTRGVRSLLLRDRSAPAVGDASLDAERRDENAGDRL